MISLGIDPGTSRWAFVFLEDGEIVEEESIPTSEIKENPEKVVELAMRARMIVAPSGYGTVLKKVEELTENDFSEIILKRDDETVMGLEKVLRMFKALNAYVVPGVKLLPTVPKYKKRNKIDMGTPDKVCAATAGIVEQKERLGLRYNQTNFILAEIGYGFDAFLSVKDGKIIDGIGGTMASSTWRGEDGELLYLRGMVGKKELRKSVGVEEVAKGAIKDILTLQNENKSGEIFVSGSRSEDVIDFLRENFKHVERLETCRSSNAAYGAAVIADGLAGGRFKEITELLELKKASGSNLDYTDLK